MDAIHSWSEIEGRILRGRRVAAASRRSIRLARDPFGHVVHVSEPEADGGIWVLLTIDIGNAARFAPERVLAAAAKLLSAKAVVRGRRLLVRQALRYGRFGAADLDRALREVSQDAVKLERMSGKFSAPYDQYSE